jgi:hypothetical protein
MPGAPGGITNVKVLVIALKQVSQGIGTLTPGTQQLRYGLSARLRGEVDGFDARPDQLRRDPGAWIGRRGGEIGGGRPKAEAFGGVQGGSVCHVVQRASCHKVAVGFEWLYAAADAFIPAPQR